MKILFFGPNGSGKGTQGAKVKEKYGIPHIETGVIFRENISGGTDLGKEAKDTSTAENWCRIILPSP